MTDKKKDEGRKINTGGGAYVEGEVHVSGGDFVGRDKHVYTDQSQHGATMDGFVQLLEEIRSLLKDVELKADFVEVIDDDFEIVEKQAKKEKPDRAIILSKLESAAKMLTTAVGAGTAIQKLVPMVQQAIQWAGQLFT